MEQQQQQTETKKSDYLKIALILSPLLAITILPNIVILILGIIFLAIIGLLIYFTFDLIKFLFNFFKRKKPKSEKKETWYSAALKRNEKIPS